MDSHFWTNANNTKEASESFVVDFLIWLPDWLFIWIVKAVAVITNLCYLAAEKEGQQEKSSNGLSKKRLMMLAEIYANNRDGGTRGWT